MNIDIMQRDISVDILKGIGIILVVVGHANCPLVLRNIIYSFHMPLFFICSGLFFSFKDADDFNGFLIRRIQRLYFPFVKWSVIFLLLHNVFFKIGVLNGEYGNTYGVVSEYYSFHDILIHFANIIFRMSGYEPFVLGAFWFLRALFVGSILLCALVCLIRKCGIKDDRSMIIGTITAFCLGGVLSFLDVKIPLYPQGGFRDLMAAFFVGCGFFIKKYSLKITWKTSVIFLFIFFACFIISPSKMSKTSTVDNWLLISMSGSSGSIVLFYLCRKMSMKQHIQLINQIFAYIGKRSFYILALHFLFFKPVVYLYAVFNSIDWRVVGCHPCYRVENCWFWAVCTICSIIFSLAVENLIEKLQVHKNVKNV